MGLPFKNGEEIAEFCGYGDLYRRSEEFQANAEKVAESKRMEAKTRFDEMISKFDAFDKSRMQEVYD